MIDQGRFELSGEPIIWWDLTAAFVMTFGLVLSANVFSDALRDALDPRLGIRIALLKNNLVGVARISPELGAPAGKDAPSED